MDVNSLMPGKGHHRDVDLVPGHDVKEEDEKPMPNTKLLQRPALTADENGLPHPPYPSVLRHTIRETPESPN